MATLFIGDEELGTYRFSLSYGKRVWTARAHLVDSVDVAVGSSVSIDVGGALFSGTVVESSNDLGRAAICIVGGAGALRLRVSPSSLRNGSGVRLSAALKHLFDAANEAGRKAGLTSKEVVNVESDMVIGKAWAAISDTAAGIISATVKTSWFVDRFGVTRIGAAKPADVDASEFSIPFHSQTDKIATIAPNEDGDCAKIIDSIGATLIGDPITKGIKIGSVSIEETDVLRLHVSS